MIDVNYICPYWGSEKDTAAVFLDKVVQEGYNGVEINLPEAAAFTDAFMAGLEKIRAKRPGFAFIAQCVPEGFTEPEEHIQETVQRLETLAALKPDFINCHTGRDYYSFQDNCRSIEAVENTAAKTGVRIVHETHRGRFSFHAPALVPYLEKFPEMELTGDFSHWCNVSESMLQGQEETLRKIIPQVAHIHARIGFEQGPQVNHPFAPEWQQHLEKFTAWWQTILKYRAVKGAGTFTITPESGPAPYMPALPYTQEPVANQWQVNAMMKDYLKTVLP